LECGPYDLRRAGYKCEIRMRNFIAHILTKMIGEAKTSHLIIITPETMAKMQPPPVSVGPRLSAIDGATLLSRVLENTAAEAGLAFRFADPEIDGKAPLL